MLSLVGSPSKLADKYDGSPTPGAASLDPAVGMNWRVLLMMLSFQLQQRLLWTTLKNCVTCVSGSVTFQAMGGPWDNSAVRLFVVWSVEGVRFLWARLRDNIVGLRMWGGVSSWMRYPSLYPMSLRKALSVNLRPMESIGIAWRI